MPSDILEEVTRADIRKTSNHPHRLLEDMLKALAMEKLREHPTIPQDAQIDDVDAGCVWPGSFCAFQDCKWKCSKVDEEALEQHWRNDHYTDLEPITHQLPVPDKDDVMSVYNEAIATRCRMQAPIAGRRRLLDRPHGIAGVPPCYIHG
eukprot:4282893-Amphidinium_carterae.3